MGIGPTYAAWKAAVLPLNYTRNGEILPPRRRLSTRGKNYPVDPVEFHNLCPLPTVWLREAVCSGKN